MPNDDDDKESSKRIQQHSTNFAKSGANLSEKRALHPYIKAVTIEDHLVPSKILSKQAKLAQLLHCMEIYRIQKNLIEKEQREMAELYCHQAAQEEEQASEVSLELMNQLCQADSALRELKEKMRKLGMNVDDNDEEKGCSGARVIVGLYHHFRM